MIKKKKKGKTCRSAAAHHVVVGHYDNVTVAAKGWLITVHVNVLDFFTIFLNLGRFFLILNCPVLFAVFDEIQLTPTYV
jgi:hypothetical protein